MWRTSKEAAVEGGDALQLCLRAVRLNGILLSGRHSGNPAYRAAQNVTGGQAVETSRMRHEALNKVTLPTHIRVCRLQIHVATVWTDGRIERCENTYYARFWLDEAGKVRHTR
jgi:hypothetical protein